MLWLAQKKLCGNEEKPIARRGGWGWGGGGPRMWYAWIIEFMSEKTHKYAHHYLALHPTHWIYFEDSWILIIHDLQRRVISNMSRHCHLLAFGCMLMRGTLTFRAVTVKPHLFCIQLRFMTFTSYMQINILEVNWSVFFLFLPTQCKIQHFLEHIDHQVSVHDHMCYRFKYPILRVA